MSSIAEPLDQTYVQRLTAQRDFSERDKLLEEFQTYAAPIRASIARDLDISQNSERREIEGALYPDIHDSSFLSKLLRKREFKETQQAKITDATLKDNVCNVQEFEYTSVQKFVAQFMSPDTPYNGMLLYHGVGVGKTCTAILTAEVFLELSPKNKVYILAPPAIQPGFYRTIFDSSRIKFGVDDEPNQHEGCTGNRYLELTQTQFERETKDIELRVNRLINKRYSILGYVAFRNMVRGILKQIPSTLTGDRKRQQETRLLRKALSGCLFIVDEAHNMRDVGVTGDEEGQEDEADDPIEEKGDAAGGKKLTPYLRKVLKTCEGNKLLLMTATPMYNTYKEIVSLLNLLLLVDRAEDSELLKETDIQFHLTESGEQLTAESEAKLLRVANGHVSFMRGENPKAFPARLDPAAELRITSWPSFEPSGLKPIEPVQQKDDVMRLPLVKCELLDDSLAVIKNLTERLVGAKGVGIRTIDTLLQAGNCIFPGEGLDGRVGTEGFQAWFAARAVAATFEGTRLSTLPQYIPANEGGNYIWMSTGRNTLGKASPKFNRIIQTIKNASGISFVYSRFVENGAIIFCLLLEANGYTPWGRSAPLFSKGVVTPGGRQCAKCEKRELGHPKIELESGESRSNHTFAPAYYALLTASAINTVEKQALPLSPNNPRVVTVARDNSNADGSKIKVIVGSQVAGEGLDLRAIREIHILEGWFHLSKEEQIIGRGIRYCSHQALDYIYRNCTINLYVNVFPTDVNKETIDQYSYRTAMNKAVRMGNVSRVLRQGAADCNLNRDAILVNGLRDVDMVDSQRVERKVNLNDRDFTSVCDWIRCNYDCKPSIDVKSIPDDNSTYDMYAARFAEQSLIVRLKRLFKEQVWFRLEDIQQIFHDIPKPILMSLLVRIVGNPSIVFENGTLSGHIIYRNNLFIFQPNAIQDQAIPLALRYGRYPIKRDSYQAEKVIVPPQASIRPRASVKPSTIATEVVQEAATEVVQEATPIHDTIDEARELWIQITKWINSWAADGVLSIVEQIPNTDENPLSKAILAYAGDSSKKDNIEARLKKLQWWGRSIIGAPDGLRDLRIVALQFVWDSFLKGAEQVALLQEDIPYTKEAGNEQSVILGSAKAERYLALDTKELIYVCAEGPCAPSIVKLFAKSTTDPIINTRANQIVTAETYGFMVPWENAMMFKTNSPKPEGKDPGGGAACSIVSNVAGHRKKIVELGHVLAAHTEGNAYELTDEVLTGTRKLTGAPNFCALMEIVMRWMDVRRASYGNKRFFYRPLASYYSNHKSKK